MITANLTGLADLQRRLEQLSKDEATKAGQAANRSGAGALAKEVKKTAPVSDVAEGTQITRHKKGGGTRQETHHKIKNSIRVKRVKTAEVGVVKNAVTAGPAYQARYVNFGSIHNTANPFMLNALNGAQQDIMDAIAKSLNKQLIKRGV